MSTRAFPDRPLYILGIVVAALLAFMVLPVGFAVGTACTNHFNCTNDVCSPACDRVNLAGAFAFLGEIAVIALLGATLDLRRARSVWVPVVAVLLSLEIAWAAWEIAMSWTSVH